MKPHSRIHQFCAFSLILLFTLQAGLGLWLHRALHQHPAKPVAYSKSTLPVVQQHTTFSNACSCTDDFLVPFIAVSTVEVIPPFQIFFVQSTHAGYANVSSELQVFRPLRAPPVLTV
jgi:hypothetical protein